MATIIAVQADPVVVRLGDVERRRIVKEQAAWWTEHANLSVDGLWCDFSATNDLIDNDLIRPAQLAPAGMLAIQMPENRTSPSHLLMD